MKAPFYFPLSLACLTAIFPLSAPAQIVPDGSLGAEGSVVVPAVINGLPSDQLEGGIQRDGNLFHSFGEFSVPDGRGAYFVNPAGVANIFSRVTGGNISQVLGTLGVLGNANLYFLNPNGIVFGPNARLDVRGSFLATTADSFIFDNGFEFSASNPTAPPLLTVNIPIGLRFRDNPGDIMVQTRTSNGLGVDPGQSLGLLGGAINLDGGRLIAPGSNIYLGGLGEAGGVALAADGTVIYDPLAIRSDVSLINNSQLNVLNNDGGQITIFAENVSVNNSRIIGGIGRGGSLETSQGGDTIINVNENLMIDNDSLVTNNVRPDGLGNSGKVNITAKTIEIRNSAVSTNVSGSGNSGGIVITADNVDVRNGGEIDSSVQGVGVSGKIIITASDTLTISGRNQNQTRRSSISSLIEENGNGTSGGIKIDIQDLAVLNSGEIISNTTGRGNSGLIEVNAKGNIQIDGDRSRIASEVRRPGVGNAGEIIVNVENLSLTNGGEINASTFSQGNAGIVRVNARGSIVIDGERSNEDVTDGDASRLFSRVHEGAVGNSGGIVVNASDLMVTNGGEINASTDSQGNAGLIEIKISGDIIIDGERSNGFPSAILSQIDSFSNSSIGDSEGIVLEAQNLNISNGGEINASTNGKGNAGRIQIDILPGGEISLSGNRAGNRGNSAPSAILSQVGSVRRSTEGNSGGIVINTGNLSLDNQGVINSSTFANGNAGEIKINATGDVTIDGLHNQGGPSNISSRVEETAQGNSGAITLTVNNLSLLRGGEINASTSGNGKSGKIEVSARRQVNLSGELTRLSSQVANDAVGESEGIVINAESLFLTEGAIIDTSTLGNGNAGNIDIVVTGEVSISGAYRDETLDRDIGGILAYTTTAGTAGNITLTAPLLNLSDGAGVEAFTQGEGAAGSVDITAAESVDIKAGSRIIAETSGAGRPGSITVTTNTLSIGQEAQLSATATQDSENEEGGGSINLNAQNLNIAGTLGIFAETQGKTPAGNLTINPNDNNPDLNIRFTDNGFISARTTATGQGGNIDISAPNLIDIRGQGRITAETSGAGNAGSIEFSSQSLNLADGVEVSATTTGTGNAGNIRVNTPVNLTIGADSSLTAETQSAGRAGDITVTAETINLGTNAELSATATEGSNNPEGGGSINLNASLLSVSGTLGIFAETQGQAPAGNLTIRPELTPDLNIRFTNNGFISARTTATGQGGNIDISAPNVIDIRGLGKITAETSGTGNAGSIEFTSQRLNLADGVEVSATTTGTGNAGNIRVNTPVNLTIGANSRLTAETQSAGRAGDITVTAETINLGTNAELSARATQTSTNQEGGGSINLNASLLNISGQLGIFAETQGAAPAGNLTIRPELTPDLNIHFTENGFISALTTASGQGGNIDISAPDLIDIRGQGRITTETSGTGNAGVINLNSQRLNLQDGIAVSASTSNTGQGGSLTITAPESIRLQGAQLSTQATSAGEAGDINLTTRQLQLTENGLISASSNVSRGGDVRLQNLETLTVNQGGISASTVDGSAGSLTVNSYQLAVNRVSLNQGSLAVKATGTGNSGNLSVNARTVELNNGAEISASTNSGAGGNITLPQLETLDINNSQISASTATGSAGSILINSAERVRLQNQGRITVEATDGGTAGNLELTTDTLTVTENSRVSVSSLTGQAGNINIRTKDLLLDRGAITAETGTSDQESGANINLSASNLLTLRLQNESLISATANADADGGNITIDAPFLLTYPATGPDGNDIIAKAVRGAGGQITVNALGIFGISEGRAIAGNQSNNFDASSEFGAPGVVQLNQAVDPNRGLTQLPETVTDPNELIAQNVCRRGKDSELTQTGKGGLPPTLEDDFHGEQTLPPLVAPATPQSSAPLPQGDAPISSREVQPAHGWLMNAQGQVELVSYQTQGLEVRLRSGKVSQCP